MSNAVEKAKQVRAAGCSCAFLVLWLPIAAVGLLIAWACLRSLF